jgi:hypothetical protein
MYSPKSALLAPTPPGLTERAAQIILARPHGAYTDHDIANVIIPAYIAQCAAVGLDAAIVLAQLIHETGNLASWWAARPRRNPAGIGVTGRTQGAQPPTGIWQQRNGWWVEGIAFASWKDDAIPAHIGRLLAYALPAGQGTPAQQQLIAQALAIRPLPAAFRGAATRLQGLNGRWAWPGLFYAQKLAALANTLVRRV